MGKIRKSAGNFKVHKYQKVRGNSNNPITVANITISYIFFALIVESGFSKIFFLMKIPDGEDAFHSFS